ncbi:hypothetical protein PFISCL1PPCAC_12828, partial [Pristionchus fissidentatus]
RTSRPASRANAFRPTRETARTCANFLRCVFARTTTARWTPSARRAMRVTSTENGWIASARTRDSNSTRRRELAMILTNVRSVREMSVPARQARIAPTRRDRSHARAPKDSSTIRSRRSATTKTSVRWESSRRSARQEPESVTILRVRGPAN